MMASFVTLPRPLADDPQAFCLVCLMTANVETSADMDYLRDTLMSITDQTQKVGLFGLSLYLNADVCPDATEFISQTVLAIGDRLAAGGHVRVLNQRTAKPEMQQLQQLVQRIPGWLKQTPALIQKTWLVFTPHRAIWHPYRVEEYAGAIALTRPGMQLSAYPISCVCLLESTVDHPDQPALEALDGLSARDVDDAIAQGLIYHKRCPAERRAEWLSELHDLAVPLHIATDYFTAPDRQWIIGHNRFADSDFAFWIRVYNAQVFKTVFPGVEHWMLYWRRPANDDSIAHAASTPGSTPMRALPLVSQAQLREHAESIAEMWEVKHFQEAATNIRKEQVSLLGDEGGKSYMKICAETLIARAKARAEFEKIPKV